MAKILFLTTAHKYDDDRIFFHQAKELKKNGFDVKISSLCSEHNGDFQGIDVESFSILDQSSKAKTEAFRKVINSFQPDCIICSEPLAVIAAKNANSSKSEIIYDITEWYPSYRMVQQYSFIPRIFHTIKFTMIQLYAGFLSDRFIFGEHSKKFPLAYVFPFKKSLMLPYFPDEDFLFENIKVLEKEKITLCYTGRISKEDGIENFFNAVNSLRKKKPNLQITLLIIGRPKRESDREYFEDLLKRFSFENVIIKDNVPFQEFSKSFSEADICFDLRENNKEYSRSLPIKIFYYAGSGKPVIYTELEAIKRDVEVEKFGYLVNPEDSEHIATLIEKYLDNPELYHFHAKSARTQYVEKYSWKKISKSFVDFIKNTIKK